MRDVIELLFADGFELLAACLQLLIELEGFLGHDLVRLLRAADEEEIFAFGDALVAVGIQANAEQRGLAFRFFGVRHETKLAAKIVFELNRRRLLAALSEPEVRFSAGRSAPAF